MTEPEKKRTRAANGASSIYKGANGKWHGRVTVGLRDDGRPDRRHVEAKTKAEVTKKVRALERQRDEGSVREVGRVSTLAEWLNHWLDNIVALTAADSTLDGYRSAINVHLIPGLGAHRLDRLEPEHIERLYLKMQQAGASPGNIHFVHRCLRAALNEAVRRDKLRRNPARLARRPPEDDEEIEPYTPEEIRRILSVAAEGRNSARWAFALALGLRQGEVLGLTWSDVDLESGVLSIRRSRKRPKYAHGCGGTCGRRHGGYCPRRVELREATGRTKSRAGRRRIALPKELLALLRAHQTEQAQERIDAGSLWNDGGWLFADQFGRPVIPNTDYHAWKTLIQLAKVRDSRLHDARHTAATALLVLGVSERAVMGIMGWSNGAMAKRYQHITEEVRHDVANRLNQMIWPGDGV